jgi:hypothetical protein
VPLKHGEAGATPVDASNEDVAQMDRALVSDASCHRFDPCHPRSWGRDWHHLLRNQQMDGCRTGVAFGKQATIPLVSTKSPGRQVGRRWSAKPTIRGFDSHPGVQSSQRSLMAKPQAHNLVIAGSTPAAATNAQMV